MNISLANQIKDFCLKSYYYRPLILTLFLNLLCWAFLIKQVPLTSSWIPLHTNIYFGIDWLGPWIYIFIYPLVGLIFTLLNTFLAIILHTFEPFLSRLLILISLIIQFFVIVSLLFLTINYFS